MNTQSKSVPYAALLSMILCIASFTDAQTAEKKTLTLQGAERVIAGAKAEAQRQEVTVSQPQHARVLDQVGEPAGSEVSEAA